MIRWHTTSLKLHQINSHANILMVETKTNPKTMTTLNGKYSRYNQEIYFIAIPSLMSHYILIILWILLVFEWFFFHFKYNSQSLITQSIN